MGRALIEAVRKKLNSVHLNLERIEDISPAVQINHILILKIDTEFDHLIRLN